MDYEALKDQWSDVEDRDGLRLSWNTFPSSRMVRVWLRGQPLLPVPTSHHPLNMIIGSFSASRPHWCHLHPSQGEARHPNPSI